MPRTITKVRPLPPEADPTLEQRLEYLQDFSVFDQVSNRVRNLLIEGDLEICPQCGKVSAYSWSYVNTSRKLRRGQVPIAHIPTASGFEWQCGHCQAHVVEANSPINHPCYTHAE